MKISTRSRYALRIMIYLADHYTTGYISVAELAEIEQLTPKYLEQIMSRLLKANLIMAARGSHGGYRLIYSPEQYNVYQIISTMEHDTSLTPCTANDGISCPRQSNCVSADIWQLLQSTIRELLENISLLDLLAMQEKKLNTPSLYLTYLNHIRK